MVVNALEMKKGPIKDAFNNRSLNGTYQPYQMLPAKDKDDQWISQTMDYIEWTGLLQLKRTSNKMLKNYKLANGEIEKSDYIIGESDYSDVIEPLVKEDITALELKFYPIIPTVIDVLTNEFSKRFSRITFELKDEKSANELLQEKGKEVEEVLMQQAYLKQQLELEKLGVDINSEEGQQALSPEAIKSLPSIQKYYTKDYRSLYIQWATHQMAVDNDRFSMPELERQNFKNSLTVDREFWHLQMGEDDYNLETWNPPQVFYRKSPNIRYISDAAWVGMVTLMTVPEVIDKYGWMMSQDQLEALSTLYPIKGAMYSQTGWGNENGAFYDPSMPYEWNTTGPGVAMRQFMTAYNTNKANGDIVRWILDESEDLSDADTAYLVRVSTIYWKTQRKMGHLTKINEDGINIQEIVDETYQITDKPLYNTLILKEKTKNNLIFGEHIDWFWMNETWGGYKIGPNIPGFIGQNNPSGFSPMYIGMNGGRPGRLKYQFKGDKTIWGCKLPVEGRIYNELNVKSKALVNRLAPYQVMYNVTLNQIQDIQIDELGTILVFDQRTLPKNSLGDDWGGENSFQKAYLAAKNFSMIPIDTSIMNTESPIQQMPFQKIDMSQHERIISKIKQAQWIKEEALGSVGLNPQRMGTPVDREQTATGIQEAISASYAQTEQYFIQHSDELMPRVHQMRTDLAQFYNSTNPSIRLQYSTDEDEKVMFMLNGEELTGRDFNVVCRTRIGMRNILENIKQMLLRDNTSNATLWDRIRAIKADDMSSLDSVVKGMEQKHNQELEQKAQQEQQLQQQDLEKAQQMMQEKLQFEAEQNQLDRENAVLVAEIRSAGMSGAVDLDANAQNDYLDNLKFIEGQQNNREKLNLDRDKHLINTRLKQTDQEIQRQKIAEEAKRTAGMLTVAKINNKVKEKSKSKN